MSVLTERVAPERAEHAATRVPDGRPSTPPPPGAPSPAESRLGALQRRANAGPHAAGLAALRTMVARRAAGGGAAAAGGRGVVQGKWEYNEDGDFYETDEDTEVHGKMWEWRLRHGVEEYRYFDLKTDELSDWASHRTYVLAGTPPPMGAMFAEQRRRTEEEEDVSMDAGSDARYAFVPAPEEEDEPLEVPVLQMRLQEGVAAIQERVGADKSMLDALIAEEFQRIDALAREVSADPDSHRELLLELFAPADVEKIVQAGELNSAGMEEFKAGLRYKRVYEHEQNLLTINRRTTREYLELVDELENDEDLDVTREVEETDGGDIDRLYVTIDDERWLVGTFYFGDTRFEQLKELPRGATRPVFRHRASGKEYVKDRYGRFTRRYVSRAVRYEDVLSLGEGRSMLPKMRSDEPAGGKEAKDYGDEDLEGEELSHEEKVMGQIRGYSRFLSATTSGRLATSTSRSTYQSPFGGVTVDLARVSAEGVTDAHTDDAIQDIFGIQDLGMLEFIPKHTGGETAEAKAARDAFRAREVVLDTPPQEAVLASPTVGGEPGVSIVGLTSSATEQQVRAAFPGRFRRRISYVEVNTRYKRTIGAHEGRSAFVFFKAGTDIEAVRDALRRAVREGVPGIGREAHVAVAPTGLTPAQAPDEVAIRGSVLGPSLALHASVLRTLDAVPAERAPRTFQRSLAAVRDQVRAAVARMGALNADRSTLGFQGADINEEIIPALRDLVSHAETLSGRAARAVNLSSLKGAASDLEGLNVRLRAIR
jgi:hypothetical protein